MAKKPTGKVRRTVHLRFTLPSADASHILSMVKASAPFYEMMGGTAVRLLQNVDDPGKFIHEITHRVYLIIGAIAWIGLATLAATSTDAMVRSGEPIGMPPLPW